MNLQFSKNAWNMDGLTYAYSYRFEQTPVFAQLEDCVQNRKNENTRQGFDNLSLVTTQKYGPQTRITTRCAFDKYGAPLILLAQELESDSRGVARYGNYVEIVLYENGINVWHLWMQDGKVTWKKQMSVEFPVSAVEPHTLSVLVGEDTLQIQADDRKMFLRMPQIYSSWHAGITACEGINRFYDLQIETDVKA